MADERSVPGDPSAPREGDAAAGPGPAGDQDREGVTEVVVRPLPERPASRRARVVALRQALPPVVRHPVVVGAGAAAATVAVRVAVEVARRALAGPGAPARPLALEVSGVLQHQVSVERRVHVVHEVVHHVVHHHAVHHLPPGTTVWPVRLPPRS
jgi:hypothetical protein